MATLLTLQQAKDHLRLTTPDGDPGDADLQAKVDEAEAIVLDYLKVTDLTPFVGDLVVVAAIKLQVAELYRFRGDDLEVEVSRSRNVDRESAGYLSPTIVSLLERKRDPALA